MLVVECGSMLRMLYTAKNLGDFFFLLHEPLGGSTKHQFVLFCSIFFLAIFKDSNF